MIAAWATIAGIPEMYRPGGQTFKKLQSQKGFY
jgi:hypothetical protein